jgi:hypothetical protein
VLQVPDGLAAEQAASAYLVHKLQLSFFAPPPLLLPCTPGLATPVQAMLHLQHNPAILVQLDLPLRAAFPTAMQRLIQGFEKQMDGLHSYWVGAVGPAGIRERVKSSGNTLPPLPSCL